MSKKVKQVVSVRLDYFTIERLDDLCEKYRTNRADIIENLINQEYRSTEVLCIKSGNGFLQGKKYPVISENNGCNIVNEHNETFIFFDYITEYKQDILMREEDDFLAQFVRVGDKQ